ncbi:hypothetical protein STEG23_016750 [Scotinomys teguina]
MWYIHTMEYYAAEKNNDIMKFAGKWMELENVILIEQDIPENTEEGGVDDLLTSSEQYENLESQEDMSEELKWKHYWNMKPFLVRVKTIKN